jgi:hypothetical protein
MKKIDQAGLRKLLRIANNCSDWMKRPLLLEGLWTITTGTVVVMIPKQLVECDDYIPGEENRYNNAFSDLIACEHTSVNFKTLVDKLLEDQVQYTIEFEMVTCSNCYGAKEFLCEACNHTHDCERCDGMGEIEGYKYPVPKKMYWEEVGFIIQGVPFLANMVVTLSEISAAMQLSDHEWNVVKYAEHKLVFGCNGIQILAMGCRPDGLKIVVSEMK